MSKMGDLILQMQEDAYTYDVGTFVDKYGDNESNREFYSLHCGILETPSGPFKDPDYESGSHYEDVGLDTEFILSNN
tara:strand:+ start:211 stop:441 length:231 start_codon:yes stop_codon:yes gene_type:complete